VSTIEEELQALRDAIRSAHEALRDLRVEHKAMRETLLAWRAEKLVWAEEANEQFGTIVKEGLDDFGKSLKKAIDDGTARVYKRFDALADIMMGEESGTNQESMAELVRRWKARQY
jgi:hypothetical protein